MTPQEIIEILGRHERWLKKQQGDVRANFAQKSLIGLNFDRSNLQQSKFRAPI